MVRYLVVGMLAAAGLLAALAYPQTVHACSCVEFTRAELFERAESVFAGEATSVKAPFRIPFTGSGLDPVTVEFAVSEVWKGPQQAVLTVRTARSEASCGYDFQEGGKYIVYVRDGETGLCSGTMPTWRAFEDITTLGAGWQPDPTPETVPRQGGGCSPFAALASGRPDVGVMALLAGTIVLGAGRRPRL